MKRLLTSICCFLNVILSWGDAQEPTFCKTFVYDERVHDFGNIEEAKGKATHTFTFTNKGKTTIAISDVRLWCGCTEAQFTKEPIKPGGKAKITISFNPSHRPGHFSKEAVVLLNGGDAYTRIWVKGNVIPMEHPVTEDHPYHLGEGLYASQQILPFGAVRPGTTDSLRLLIANGSNHDMTIEFIRKPDNKLLEIPRKIILKAGQRKKIYARYHSRYTYDYRRQINITPVVNGKETKPIRVTWLANAEKGNDKTKR